MVKDNRQKILTLYREGLSLRMIASNLKVAHSTVCYHIQKMNQVSLERKKKSSGRPRAIHPNRFPELKKFLLKNKRFGAEKLVREVNLRYGVNISSRTLMRYQKELHLKFGPPKKAPLLTDQHRKNQVIFAKKHLKTDWTPYIFSDEKTFYLNAGKTGERYEIGNRPVKQTLKHPPKLHVWWGISLSWKIYPYFFTTNLDQELYRIILSERLPQKNSGQWILQQDNDPKHKANKTKRWLDDHTQAWMKDWPAGSPDLNPIENIWSMIADKISANHCISLNSLKRIITKTCNNFPDEMIEKTIKSLPKRLRKIIKSNGETILK
jgi:transposase